MKSVTYRPTLSKFRVGPVKKNTLYINREVDQWIIEFSRSKDLDEVGGRWLDGWRVVIELT